MLLPPTLLENPPPPPLFDLVCFRPLSHREWTAQKGSISLFKKSTILSSDWKLISVQFQVSGVSLSDEGNIGWWSRIIGSDIYQRKVFKNVSAKTLKTDEDIGSFNYWNNGSSPSQDLRHLMFTKHLDHKCRVSNEFLKHIHLHFTILIFRYLLL